jgi:alpha-ketoglutarate-dependent taurine dioxygenase
VSLHQPASLPEVVVADDPEGNLDRWCERHRERIERALDGCGALLARGFHVPDAAAFAGFAVRHIRGLLPYTERSTPRREVAARVYTSTEYPADQEIALHNEFSYALRWPLRICFYCERPAASGGETSLAAARLVYREISPAVRERFERHGVMYVRRYGWGVDLPWQEAFGTTDRAVVEAYCARNRIAFEWVDRTRLITRQVRRATAVHPRTGERLWFNQAHLFHHSNLPPETRAGLRRLFGDELPREARYGDGTAIADEELAHVRAALAKSTVLVPWRAGDVLLLDNMLVHHGRRPFGGARRILVAMGDVAGEPEHDRPVEPMDFGNAPRARLDGAGS